MLQSHSHQNHTVLAQKQTHWSNEQNRDPTNKPMLIWLIVLSLSHFQLSTTALTTAHQAPLSNKYPRQEYWSGLPSPADLLNPGTEPKSLASPALAGTFFTTAPPGNNSTSRQEYTVKKRQLLK